MCSSCGSVATAYSFILFCQGWEEIYTEWNSITPETGSRAHLTSFSIICQEAVWGGSYNLLLTLRGGKVNCTLLLLCKKQSIAPLDEEFLYSVSFGDRSRRYEGDERSWIGSDRGFCLLWLRARDFSWFPHAYSDVGACPCVGALLKPVNCRSSELNF